MQYCFLFIFEDRFLIREPTICNFSKQTALWILVTLCCVACCTGRGRGSAARGASFLPSSAVVLAAWAMEFEDFDDDLLNDLEDMPASSNAHQHQHPAPGKPKVADSSQQQPPTRSFIGNSSGAKVGALGKLHGDQMRAVIMLSAVGTHRSSSFSQHATDEGIRFRIAGQRRRGGSDTPIQPGRDRRRAEWAPEVVPAVPVFPTKRDPAVVAINLRGIPIITITCSPTHLFSPIFHPFKGSRNHAPKNCEVCELSRETPACLATSLVVTGPSRPRSSASSNKITSCHTRMPEAPKQAQKLTGAAALLAQLEQKVSAVPPHLFSLSTVVASRNASSLTV